MSIQGYKMWTNELSTQERVYNQWYLSVKTIQHKNIIVVDYFYHLILMLSINRDRFALGVMPLVNKNGLYDMKMGNLFHSVLWLNHPNH
jgi:hypothetical protein